jgi:hypothetical protein
VEVNQVEEHQVATEVNQVEGHQVAMEVNQEEAQVKQQEDHVDLV